MDLQPLFYLLMWEAPVNIYKPCFTVTAIEDHKNSTKFPFDAKNWSQR